MTIDEAARVLFVSRVHVRHLLEIGELVEVTPRNPSGTADIDMTSVQGYRAKRSAAARAFFESQTEDDDPPGL